MYFMWYVAGATAEVTICPHRLYRDPPLRRARGNIFRKERERVRHRATRKDPWHPLRCYCKGWPAPYFRIRVKPAVDVSEPLVAVTTTV
jgi:hypothetical protein